jgi:hypothetical protein
MDAPGHFAICAAVACHCKEPRERACREQAHHHLRSEGIKIVGTTQLFIELIVSIYIIIVLSLEPRNLPPYILTKKRWLLPQALPARTIHSEAGAPTYTPPKKYADATNPSGCSGATNMRGQMPVIKWQWQWWP